jgi:hypothetical protein
VLFGAIRIRSPLTDVATADSSCDVFVTVMSVAHARAAPKPSEHAVATRAAIHNRASLRAPVITIPPSPFSRLENEMPCGFITKPLPKKNVFHHVVTSAIQDRENYAKVNARVI